MGLYSWCKSEKRKGMGQAKKVKIWRVDLPSRFSTPVCFLPQHPLQQSVLKPPTPHPTINLLASVDPPGATAVLTTLFSICGSGQTEQDSHMLTLAVQGHNRIVAKVLIREQGGGGGGQALVGYQRSKEGAEDFKK